MKLSPKKMFFLLICFLNFSVPLFAYKWELSATMIFQDEAPYLKEWIEYHKLVGVQHFYLYNNNSTDDYLGVLQPYIKDGIVELREWNYAFDDNDLSKWNHIQCAAYMDALEQCKKKTRWLMILDSDEFFVPTADKDLISMLNRFKNDEKLAAVYGKWIFFGTSHVEMIPDNKLMIELLLMNSGAPGPKASYKGINRPDRVALIQNPHWIEPKEGFKTMHLKTNLLQVNHYWTRDEYYLHNVKIPRREKIGTPRETVLQWAESQNGPANEFSLPIIRYVPKLHKRMGF